MNKEEYERLLPYLDRETVKKEKAIKYLKKVGLNSKQAEMKYREFKKYWVLHGDKDTIPPVQHKRRKREKVIFSYERYVERSIHSKEVIEKVIEMYNEGYSARMIYKATGLTKNQLQAMRRKLLSFGKIKYKELSEADIEIKKTISRLYCEGYTYKEIAESVGKPIGTISTYICKQVSLGNLKYRSKITLKEV